MKRTLLTLVAVFTFISSMMAQNVAKEIEASYLGDLYISLAELTDTDEPIPNQSIQIVADGENTVTLSIYNFAFFGNVLGDIVLEKVPVSKNAEGSVVFGENSPVELNFVEAGITATAKINEASSYVNDEAIVANIDVVWTNADVPTPIYVRFVGNEVSEAASQASGAYTGDLYISLAELTDTDEPMPNQNIQIVADGEQTVTLSIYNFAFAGAILGDIVLTKVPVAKQNDGTITFGENSPVNLDFTEAGIQATAKINEKTSLIKNGEIVANIDVVWTNAPAPTPIYVRFVGKNPTPLAIENVTTNLQKDSNTIYSITGVRVNERNLQKGIYVRGGKKFIVK